MLSILYTALVMFISGVCLSAGMILVQIISKLVTIAIAKHKMKKIMKGE